jgi:hypothetical protein
MGTPHRGSAWADWGSILAMVAKVAFLSPKKEFLDDLKRNGKSLSKLSEDFVKIASKYKFKSFYEENKVKGIKAVCAHLNIFMCYRQAYPTRSLIRIPA